MMQWVKIQVPQREDSIKVFLEVSRRGRIDCYPDNVYMVPEPALQLLADLGITYQELGRGGMDYAEKTLRDAFASHAQRRPASQPRQVLSDV